MKTCTKCGETKQLTEFDKNAGTRDGLYAWCKACARAKDRKWRATNPDKQKTYDAKRNQEARRAYLAKWRAENREYRQTTTSKWFADNPVAKLIYAQNRRARKLDAGGKLSKDLAKRLFKLQRGKCACCGKPLGDNYHLDHIMPLALGGTNEDSNIQLLRAECNMQKHAKHPVDFMQERGFLL